MMLPAWPMFEHRLELTVDVCSSWVNFKLVGTA